MDIYFIYADGCLKCMEMERLLMRFKSKKDSIIGMECDTDDAVNFAVENGIDDLPACKINETIIQGENFSSEDIQRAFKG